MVAATTVKSFAKPPRGLLLSKDWTPARYWRGSKRSPGYLWVGAKTRFCVKSRFYDTMSSVIAQRTGTPDPISVGPKYDEMFNRLLLPDGDPEQDRKPDGHPAGGGAA
jgi:hypothetical protein